MASPKTDEDLIPIDEVARRLGLRASAIRYYGERGLVEPRSRHSGRRWYGEAEVRRLAIIRFWQDSGLMSLNEIAQLLSGDDSEDTWPTLVRRQVSSLDAQIERMQEAKLFLEHVLSEHPDERPDGCPHYEALIFGEAPDHRH